MRKWIIGVGVAAIVAASMAIATPAGADHGMAEGCIVTAAAHACSGSDPAPGATGMYTVTSGHTVGAAGAGPYTIAWTDPDGLGPCTSGTHSKAAGEGDDGSVELVGPSCQGTVVTATSEGGAFAAGDTD